MISGASKLSFRMVMSSARLRRQGWGRVPHTLEDRALFFAGVTPGERQALTTGKGTAVREAIERLSEKAQNGRRDAARLTAFQHSRKHPASKKPTGPYPHPPEAQNRSHRQPKSLGERGKRSAGGLNPGRAEHSLYRLHTDPVMRVMGIMLKTGRETAAGVGPGSIAIEELTASQRLAIELSALQAHRGLAAS